MTKKTHLPLLPLPRSYCCRKKFDKVYQFHIALHDIEPMIWRRIQVPECCSFWDLHCAITDAFGWLDYHLHQFTIRNQQYPKMDKIGIPDGEGFPKPPQPGWKLFISDYFGTENAQCEYNYDFGDDWRHTVTLEKVVPREAGVAYPRCVGGERACPPEDVGGSWGYEKFLKAISGTSSPVDEEEDEEDEEEVDLLQWCGGWFDPEWFDLGLIRFGNPFLRWRVAFRDEQIPETIRTVQYHRMRAEG